MLVRLMWDYRYILPNKLVALNLQIFLEKNLDAVW